MDKGDVFGLCPHPEGTLGWFRWYVKDVPDEAELLLPVEAQDVEVIYPGRKIGELSNHKVRLGGREHNPDFRVRLQVDGYRVVAPKAERKGRRGGYMNGDLVIEVRSKDALGNEIWSWLSDVNREADPALYRLLAGPDALDGNKVQR